MVLDEEKIGGDSQECVRDFNYNLQTTKNVSLTSSKKIHLRFFAYMYNQKDFFPFIFHITTAEAVVMWKITSFTITKQLQAFSCNCLYSFEEKQIFNFCLLLGSVSSMWNVHASKYYNIYGQTNGPFAKTQLYIILYNDVNTVNYYCAFV